MLPLRKRNEKAAHIMIYIEIYCAHRYNSKGGVQYTDYMYIKA